MSIQHKPLPVPTNLTQEELVIIKECNREAFYYRCIPLSFLFGGLTNMGIDQGYLKGNAKFGKIPKLAGSIFFGYILGKISYSNECRNKLMQLPNSEFGDFLRKRNENKTYTGTKIQDLHSDQQGMKSEDDNLHSSPMLEEYTPDLSQHSEGNDSFSQVTDNLSQYVATEEKKSISDTLYTGSSYDELRKMNRDKSSQRVSEVHVNKSLSQFQAPSFEDSNGPPLPESEYNYPSETSPKPDPYFNSKKNKYGDTWDN